MHEMFYNEHVQKRVDIVLTFEYNVNEHVHYKI